MHIDSRERAEEFGYLLGRNGAFPAESATSRRTTRLDGCRQRGCFSRPLRSYRRRMLLSISRSFGRFDFGRCSDPPSGFSNFHLLRLGTFTKGKKSMRTSCTLSCSGGWGNSWAVNWIPHGFRGMPWGHLGAGDNLGSQGIPCGLGILGPLGPSPRIPGWAQVRNFQDTAELVSIDELRVYTHTPTHTHTTKLLTPDHPRYRLDHFESFYPAHPNPTPSHRQRKIPE